MKVGTLYTLVKLDRDSRIYTGPGDPITGNVVLAFKAWDREKGETSTTELFGPLKINVTLEGDLRTEIDEDYMHNISEPEYRDERKLFVQSYLVYDDQLRAPVGENKGFPFRVFFPKRALPTPQQRKNGVPEEELDELPPALKVDFAGTYGSGKSTMEYRISAKVEVAGIEVDIANRGVSPALKYRPAMPEKGVHTTKSTFDQDFSVTSEEFIPESERPHGFRAKAKAILKDVEPPTYAFSLRWNGLPDYIHPDKPIQFQVCLRTKADSTTTTTIPDVSILEGDVTILGYCAVRVVPRYQNPKESAEMKDLNDPVIAFNAVGLDGPFSKESDHTKEIVTGPLPYMPPTFTVERLSRYYKVRVDMTLLVGSQKVKARREWSVTVLPPLGNGNPSSQAITQVGPSQRPQEQEKLPL